MALQARLSIPRNDSFTDGEVCLPYLTMPLMQLAASPPLPLSARRRGSSGGYSLGGIIWGERESAS